MPSPLQRDLARSIGPGTRSREPRARDHRRTSPRRIVAYLALALLGYGLIQIGPVYYRSWRFGLALDKAFHEYDGVDEKIMLDGLIRVADFLGLPELTPDNFTCDCAPGTDSVLTCAYTETVRFPAGFTYRIKQQIQVKAFLPASSERPEARPEDLLQEQPEPSPEEQPE